MSEYFTYPRTKWVEKSFTVFTTITLPYLQAVDILLRLFKIAHF